MIVKFQRLLCSGLDSCVWRPDALSCCPVIGRLAILAHRVFGQGVLTQQSRSTGREAAVQHHPLVTAAQNADQSWSMRSSGIPANRD